MTGLVRAIDVGYGSTKYVTQGEHLGDIRCAAFPSLAPRASGRELALDGRTRRQTVHVPVDALLFEVGPDAQLAQDAVWTAPLDDAYTDSAEYLALVRGALRYMQVARLALLVVGLPVGLYRERRGALARRLVGTHDLGDGSVVTVDAVQVLAQPVGALLSAAVEHPALRDLLGARLLVVDAGWRTFDWVVTEGPKILDRRSDSVSKGMYEVVDAIARALGRDQGVQPGASDRLRIDEALRSGRPVRFFGKPVALAPYRALGERIADESVSALRRLVQDGADLDAIVLAGGAAFFFEGAIARAFPRHAVTTVPEARFANCRGFQIAGLQALADRGTPPVTRTPRSET